MAASWWVVPDDALQTALYDATHAIDSQGYPGAVKESAAKPTPGSYGPYATQAAAQAELTSLGAAQHAKQTTTVSGPLSGIAAVGDFFQRLTQANTWERIGEVVLGLILIAVGVAHITHAVPVATTVAKAAGTAAVIA